MPKFNTRVNGVTFEGRQEYLELLEGNEPVQIRPEPENPYDPNALAVWIAVQGIPAHCGYIPKELAVKVAPALEGEAVMAKILEVTGGFEIPGGKAPYGLRILLEIPDDQFGNLPT